ncbi:MAG: FHA domain-containing protein [Acidobacteriota bacterium]
MSVRDGDSSTDTQVGKRLRIRRVGRGKPCLIVMTGTFPGETYVLEPGSELSIGRAAGNDIRLCYGDVSRVQARIKVSGSGKVELTDLGSTNGTFVNGRRQNFRALREGDKIQIGDATVFRFAFYDEVDREFQERLFGVSFLDRETSTLNRDRLTAWLDTVDEQATETTPYSLAVLSVDGFDVLVGLLGYAVRDYFLRELSWIIRRSVSGEAALFRLDDESFATVLPSLGPEAALDAAERIRRAVEEARLTYRGDVMRFSLAIGVATSNESLRNPEDVLSEAQRLSAAASGAGGNRVQAA